VCSPIDTTSPSFTSCSTTAAFTQGETVLQLPNISAEWLRLCFASRSSRRLATLTDVSRICYSPYGQISR
jgi:hypothetical protein